MHARTLGALIIVLFLPGVYFTVQDLTPAPHQEDFGAYYLAARALGTGASPFDAATARRLAADAGVGQHSPYIYPSLLAVTLRPLAALPYAFAAALWMALSAAALLSALWLLRPIVQMPWRVYGWVCAAVLFLPPVHHTFQHGQINHFLLLLIVASAVVEAAGGGVLAGIAAAVKVFPATLAAAYALGGRMAALAAMVGSAAVLTLAGSLFEPAATEEFIQSVAPRLAIERRLAPNNQSVDAVMARWFEPHWFVNPIANAPAAGLAAARAISIAVVGLTLWALVGVRRLDGRLLHAKRISLVLAATLIVSPIVWDHYYVLLLLPAAVLYRGSGERTTWLLLLWSAALLLAHRYWPLLFPLKSPLFMSEGLAGVVLLWIALIRMLSYDRVCAATRSPSDTRRSAIS